jgi:hypothetical protein
MTKITTKKAPLYTLNLIQHSLLTGLLSSDRFRLTISPNLQALSFEEVQTTLDVSPLPVTRSNNQYQLLTPMPLLSSLRRQSSPPEYNKLVVTLMSFTEFRASAVSNTLYISNPALRDLKTIFEERLSWVNQLPYIRMKG